MAEPYTLEFFREKGAKGGKNGKGKSKARTNANCVKAAKQRWKNWRAKNKKTPIQAVESSVPSTFAK